MVEDQEVGEGLQMTHAARWWGCRSLIGTLEPMALAYPPLFFFSCDELAM